MNPLVPFCLLVGLSAVASMLFIIWQEPNRPAISTILKSVASFAFIALGIANLFLTDNFIVSSLLVVIGLVASAFGDVFLSFLEHKTPYDKHNIIISGMVAFGIAQIFYYVAQVLYGGFSIWAVIAAIMVALAIFFGENLLKLNYGKTRWVTIAYTCLLSLSFFQSIINCVKMGAVLPSLLLVIGFAFFFASDLVLSFIYFGEKPKRWLTFLNLGLYYVGQILIASAILFL